MRTILMISLAAMMAAPAAARAQTAPDWTVRDWSTAQNDPAPGDPGWREPEWETRARREQSWEELDRRERDRAVSTWDDRDQSSAVQDDRAPSGQDWSGQATDERGHSERASGEHERRDFGWTDGEAAPILTSPIRADEIPPAAEAPADPDEAAAPPDESSSESAWDEPREARAAAAEAAARPAPDVTPWDEQAAPVATNARRARAADERPAHEDPMSRWGEVEPPRAEPSPSSEAAPEPAPAGY